MPQFSDATSHIHTLIDAALEAVDPAGCVRAAVTASPTEIVAGNHMIRLRGGKLIVVSLGKAAIGMTNGFLDVLGQIPCQGVVVTKQGQAGTVNSPDFRVHYASHPIADQSSIEAADAVLETLNGLAEQDTVIFLISGGGSSLCSKPNMNMADWQDLLTDLLGSGCDISEFNTVRQQLDQVKGGRLAEAAFPAQIMTLVLSDVVGDSAEIVASGPTVPRINSPEDAVSVLNKYGIKIPVELNNLVESDPAAPDFDSPVEFVGNLDKAAQACKAAAKGLGFETEIMQPWLNGSASLAGEAAAEQLVELEPDSCLILGGETVVEIAGSGTGGRNQELALAAALAIDGHMRSVVAAFATDGEDGPTDAAGAIVTGSTILQGRENGLDASTYLANNDSYSFFDSVDGHLIRTGPTGTNVNDLLFILKYAD